MTTIPLADLGADVSVYDDFSADEMVLGAACDTGASVFSAVREGTALLLLDANTNETLAFGPLAAGVLQNELGPQDELGPQGKRTEDIYDLFWYCYFETQLTDVPLDREFYVVSFEGDSNDEVTIDGASVRSRGYASLPLFLADNEELRDDHRDSVERTSAELEEAPVTNRDD